MKRLFSLILITFATQIFAIQEIEKKVTVTVPEQLEAPAIIQFLKENLNMQFELDRSDFTYEFLEVNLKNLTIDYVGDDLITEYIKYNKRKGANLRLIIPYRKEKGSELKFAKIKQYFKIESDKDYLSFSFKNNFNFFLEQIIGIYIRCCANKRVIMRSSSFKMKALDSKKIEITIWASFYGKPSMKKLEEEVEFIKNGILKSNDEFLYQRVPTSK